MDRIGKKPIGAAGRRSERRVTKAVGGRATPASGALTGAKGDATVGNFRLELKSTTTATMRLEWAWLEKIGAEAAAMSQTPSVIVSFVTAEGKPRAVTNAEWVLLPRWAVDELFK